MSFFSVVFLFFVPFSFLFFSFRCVFYDRNQLLIGGDSMQLFVLCRLFVVVGVAVAIFVVDVGLCFFYIPSFLLVLS